MKGGSYTAQLRILWTPSVYEDLVSNFLKYMNGVGESLTCKIGLQFRS